MANAPAEKKRPHMYTTPDGRKVTVTRATYAGILNGRARG